MKTVLIKNGHVVDPLNGLEEDLNILIRNGKIADLTHELPQADCCIDVKGKTVCPGFIDIHMHEDPYDQEKGLLDKSIAKSMVLMGVTTAVGGNCGDNVMDPSRYLDILDREGTATNLGLLAGHTFIRKACGGSDKYSPVSQQTLEKMYQYGERCLQEGCFGISFGLKYVPGTSCEELTKMASLCNSGHKLIAAHVRYDVERVFEAVKEMADVGKRLELPVQISHIGSMGGYGQMKELLGDIRKYQQEGIDIKCDCYPYDAFSTAIGETTYDDGFLKLYDSDYNNILICDGKYAGKRCTKAIFDELRATAPETMTVGYFMKEEDIALAMLEPEIMVASDGIRNGDQGHPRAAGTFPRFINKYVKTGKLPLMDAIRKMTEMPASRLGLKNKGNLTIGSDADIVVFNYDTIEDQATYEQPALPPAGMDYVLIGGKVAVSEGKLVCDSLGRTVRCK